MPPAPRLTGVVAATDRSGRRHARAARASRGHAVTASNLAQYLAAEPLDVTHALAALVQRDILEPVDDGYRLKAF
ncbi:hypothetical protein [Asaia prunellae]|uniref:hypothetical protein n=1 Tax=Asaia prunellae TaxID=610245 RepID=UPI001FB18C81|nr:hypothetical protein [Asaia prunellae]